MSNKTLNKELFTVSNSSIFIIKIINNIKNRSIYYLLFIFYYSIIQLSFNIYYLLFVIYDL